MVLSATENVAMKELLPGLNTLELPRMYRVRQRFDPTHIEDVDEAVRAELSRPQINDILRGARTVALAVGSRGIANIRDIVAATVAALRGQDVDVFITPAMGSHGGATAEGQVDVLHHLGVTEASVGAPIRSSMNVVEIGAVTSSHGNRVPVCMDEIAYREADLVVPISRIKPHTGFKGSVESGICKMITIGLGKHVGCAALHREGMNVFDHLIPTAGKMVLETGRIGFSLAIVENGYEQTAMIEALTPAASMKREGELLQIAGERMARLLMERIDVLVVERFGKNISGVGMDANVTGRGELGGALPGYAGPDIKRIVVLGLTDKTYGNAHGIGLADVITDRVFEQINRGATWTNTLTAGSLGCGRIPIGLPDERQAIMAAASCVFGVKATEAHIVRIWNTLCLTDIAVSQSMVDAVGKTPGCEVIGEWNGTWSQSQ